MMTEKETGGAAFPLSASEYAGHGPQGGMTLRDYFAAKAMQGMLAADWELATGNQICNITRNAYQVADGMIAERAK